MSQNVKEIVKYVGWVPCIVDRCTIGPTSGEKDTAEEARSEAARALWTHIQAAHHPSHFANLIEVQKIERTILDKHTYVPAPETPDDA